jgi:hypothetical protein
MQVTLTLAILSLFAIGINIVAIVLSRRSISESLSARARLSEGLRLETRVADERHATGIAYETSPRGLPRVRVTEGRLQSVYYPLWHQPIAAYVASDVEETTVWVVDFIVPAVAIHSELDRTMIIQTLARVSVKSAAASGFVDAALIEPQLRAALTESAGASV